MICPFCKNDSVDVPTVDVGVGEIQCGPAICDICSAYQERDGEWHPSLNRQCRHQESPILNIPFVLIDSETGEDGQEQKVCGSVVMQSNHYIEIRIDGFGECTAAPGCGAILVVEMCSGVPVVHVFNDISREVPITITCEKAAESNYIEEASDG